ncbi:topoisomerase I binding, arginine/serine-rich a [Synchiropus splendidus]|uniref:topoisomerase I binding, arginine/serine-rich a n=1 Tax=Synchiropus splendidus TaxID=270530 RepID=UPI00237E5626|nr:topoisomerase I binding, arginine/serine-rich a [Synchiropus splendidus]XP_053712698.1 topoisomerase I binding, arginine/serine-rich a [Synchiropus splendidus]
MSEMKIALQKSWKRDRKKASAGISEDISPDSKCPICLDVFNNVSYLDLCLHKFCFRCIHEWSKNKAECPLCKQPFNSIYHSIKSDEDFQKYDLRPVENGCFGTFGGVRFRYRTTLTGIRQQNLSRTDPLPDNGVMFEAQANAQRQRRDRYLRSIMSRLAAERRAASEGRAMQSLREQEMINFRKELYRNGMKVRTVTDGGRSRDTSAEFYRRNPACLHRLVPWLKRELLVLFGAHGSLVNIVQHIIMSSITRHNMEDEAMQEALQPFLQGRTQHFLHEFISFAKSPFNMEAYDQHAVYDCAALSSSENSSGNSSVIAISDNEENSELEQPRTPGTSMSALSNSLWDDETPGPSYFTTAESHRTERLMVRYPDTDSSSEDDEPVAPCPPRSSLQNQRDLSPSDAPKDSLSSDSDDCVIIGFIKPVKERTPELVRLSSDSESDDCKEVASVPQHIRFTSLSPSASHISETSEDTNHDPLVDPKERLLSANKSRKSSRRDREVRSDGLRDSQRAAESSHRRKRQHRSPLTAARSDRTGSRERNSRNVLRFDRKECWFGRKSPQSFYSREREAGSRHYSRHHRRRHSRSPSRGPHHRDRRRSRSRTYSSSRSPSMRRGSHSDKPGGKRKYKTRHLEEPVEHRKRSKEKHRKKSKKSSSREESPSDRSKRHHKKKKHKKKSKKHKSKDRAEKLSPALVSTEGIGEAEACPSNELEASSIDTKEKEEPMSNETPVAQVAQRDSS